ncbi:NAD(P)/FAD-dependent oxidoreductase [Parapedobacter koreensis]|uniref:Dehydrogenase (Flavoprotein) n=1 Tax=Parapedobacter koreensis TaxID=332977 RepID=A0A1H7SC63_9SPHI|nr:NAD(P)/FAD-dependent oxidoreductase [Parapedobacter koreensis]SEL69344.1 Dehydrogenase (flavoprotein) [Parapedobacter koreensis]
MISEHVDVLVIGAGPSGAVAASILHQKGVKVKVIEREHFPRFVIGESLIPRCMDHFDEAGFIEAVEAKRFEKKFGARFLRGEDVCWFDFSQKFSPGWDWTWQLPRAEFDQTLTDTLQHRGVDIAFGTTVENVVFAGTDSLTTVRDEQGNRKEIHARYLIDASGYGRVLPRLLDLDKPSTFAPMAATFVHVHDLRRPIGIEGTRITFDVLEQRIWFWVIPFSDGRTSLGLVCPKEHLEAINQGDNSKTFQRIIQQSDYYRQRFDGLDFLFEPKQIVSYAKAVKKLYGNGFALTGNSAEFLDPVFSSGVCFATESGALAANLAAKQLAGGQVDWEHEYEEHMLWGVNVFRSYIRDWYSGDLQKFFFHKEVNEDVRRKVCSVLAGYVWDKENPFVKKHDRAVKAVTHLLP